MLLLSLYIFVLLLTNIQQLCVAIDYCVLSFLESKLTLISLTENNCKC